MQPQNSFSGPVAGFMSGDAGSDVGGSMRRVAFSGNKPRQGENSSDSASHVESSMSGVALSGLDPSTSGDAFQRTGRAHRDHQGQHADPGLAAQEPGSTQEPINSVLEAEAAEHAVNYHRVRRKVQEDIRKSLIRNPVIRHKLQGPRVLKRETIAYLSAPSVPRNPANGFMDSNTIDWIHSKAHEVAKRQAGWKARDQELRLYKEEQARELELFRKQQAERRRVHEQAAAVENMMQEVRTEFANKKIASVGSSHVYQYAKDRQARMEHAKQKRSTGFRSQVPVSHPSHGV